MAEGAGEDEEAQMFGKFYTYQEIRELKPKEDKPKDFDKFPEGVVPDKSKWINWLPEGWGQGIKTTSGGKTLKCYINPSGRLYYHKKDIEKFEKMKFAEKEASNSSTDLASISVSVPPWPTGDWLPTDWLVAFRKLPSRLMRVFIHPSKQGFLYHRGDVEKYLRGEPQSMIPIGASKSQSERSAIAAAKTEGSEPTAVPKAKRVKLDIWPPCLPQTGWSACATKNDVLQAFSEYRSLLTERGFTDDTELVALHGLDSGHAHAAKINGVYYQMPLEGHICYQKLISAPGSKTGLGCDGVYIVLDTPRGHWCVAASPLPADDGRTPRFAYCRETAKLTDVQPGQWQVSSDLLGAAFEPQASLRVLPAPPAAPRG